MLKSIMFKCISQDRLLIPSRPTTTSATASNFFVAVNQNSRVKSRRYTGAGNHLALSVTTLRNPELFPTVGVSHWGFWVL
jgi:hypothetical protein